MDVVNNTTSPSPTSLDSGGSLSTTIFLLCLNAAFIAFYSFVLSVMLVDDKKHFSSSYYLIVKSIGLSDLVILVTVFLFTTTYDGVWTTHPSTIFFVRTISDRLDDSLGYFPNLFLNLLIGINRFIAVVRYERYKAIFGRRRTTFFAVACFFVGFSTANLCWWTLNDDDVYETLDGVLTFAVLGICFVAYFWALIASYVRIRSSDASAKKRLVREIKMTAQASIYGMLLLLEESAYLTTSTDADYNPLFTLVYVLYSGLNPLVNLCFDGRLRMGVIAAAKKLWAPCTPKKSQVSMVVVNPRVTVGFSTRRLDGPC